MNQVEALTKGNLMGPHGDVRKVFTANDKKKKALKNIIRSKKK